MMSTEQLEGAVVAVCIGCRKTVPCVMGWCERDLCAICVPTHAERCDLCRSRRFTPKTAASLKRRRDHVMEG